METIDYDRLPDFAGFDGHTDRIPTVWHGIENPFGDYFWSSKIPRISDAPPGKVYKEIHKLIF